MRPPVPVASGIPRRHAASPLSRANGSGIRDRPRRYPEHHRRPTVSPISTLVRHQPATPFCFHRDHMDDPHGPLQLGGGDLVAEPVAAKAPCDRVILVDRRRDRDLYQPGSSRLPRGFELLGRRYLVLRHGRLVGVDFRQVLATRICEDSRPGWAVARCLDQSPRSQSRHRDAMRVALHGIRRAAH
jgi:hypothetical protein